MEKHPIDLFTSIITDLVLPNKRRSCDLLVSNVRKLCTDKLLTENLEALIMLIPVIVNDYYGLKILLELGLCPAAQDAYGQIPMLDYMAVNGFCSRTFSMAFIAITNPKQRWAFLNHGSNKQGNTILMKCIKNNNIDMAQQLLLKGSEINLETPKTGWTVIHEAAVQNNLMALEMLLERGANPSVIAHQSTTEHTSTPISLTTNKICKQLLERYARFHVPKIRPLSTKWKLDYLTDKMPNVIEKCIKSLTTRVNEITIDINLLRVALREQYMEASAKYKYEENNKTMKAIALT